MFLFLVRFFMFVRKHPIRTG